MRGLERQRNYAKTEQATQGFSLAFSAHKQTEPQTTNNNGALRIDQYPS